MKEQVITPRVSNRAALTGKGRNAATHQRPAQRDRAGSARGGKQSRLRVVLAYLPLAGKILLALIAGVLIFAGYRAAASASFFEIRNVDTSGERRASADDIKTLVRRAASQTGVWSADLEEISAEVERLPWVRRAVISRVLPDGLRVRITERTERAVVRTSAGRFVWVDEDAVNLGTMSPTDRMPPFFIRGWDESGTSEAQSENRERIQKYLEIVREWDAAGLSQRISEINLSDVRDVRAQLAGNDSEIEVRLGGRDFGKRLASALKVLDEQRTTPRGALVTRLDATLDRRVVVGFSSGAPSSSGTLNSDDSNDAQSTNARTTERETGQIKPASLKTESRGNATRAAREQQQNRDRNKKERDKNDKAGKDRRAKDQSARDRNMKERNTKDAASTAVKASARPRRVT